LLDARPTGVLELKMQLRCEDGDLAIIVGDVRGCEGNIGRIVHVRGPVRLNKQCSLYCWAIKPVSRKRFFILESDESVTHQTVRWKDGIEHPDCWLLPIRSLDPADECLRHLSDYNWDVDKKSHQVKPSSTFEHQLILKGV